MSHTATAIEVTKEKRFLIILRTPGSRFRPMFVSETLHVREYIVYRGRKKEFAYMSPRANKICDVELRDSVDHAVGFKKSTAIRICGILNQASENEFILHPNGNGQVLKYPAGKLAIISYDDALVVHVMSS